DSYRPLAAGKRFSLKAENSVERLTVFYGEGEPFKNLEEARVREAELLASRLRSLKDSGARIEDGSPSGRPIEWGDIAVLFRAATKTVAQSRRCWKQPFAGAAMNSRRWPRPAARSASRTCASWSRRPGRLKKRPRWMRRNSCATSAGWPSAKKPRLRRGFLPR